MQAVFVSQLVPNPVEAESGSILAEMGPTPVECSRVRPARFGKIRPSSADSVDQFWVNLDKLGIDQAWPKFG